MIRDQKAKQSLIKYLEENKDQRLWQAICNWSKKDFVLFAEYQHNPIKMRESLWTNYRDTFYIEADKENL